MLLQEKIFIELTKIICKELKTPKLAIIGNVSKAIQTDDIKATAKALFIECICDKLTNEIENGIPQGKELLVSIDVKENDNGELRVYCMECKWIEPPNLNQFCDV